jgi:uncharacterized surface protein with fasciclin (FAS1) repeats
MQTIQSLLENQRWPRAFYTLSTAIRTAGLEYTLQGQKPVTLFAPSDEAFSQLHQQSIFDLLKDINKLKLLLEYHIVPLKLTQDMLFSLVSSPQGDVANNAAGSDHEQEVQLPTLSGQMLRLTCSHDLYVQGIPLLEPELEAENGTMHPVEQVLWPPELSDAPLW